MPDEEKLETLAEHYPSNSKFKKEVQPPEKVPEERKVNKVVTGPVKKKRKGFGKKIAETFLEDDTKSVSSYIFYDVLIPAAKDLISDMVGGGLDMLLFGDHRPGSSRYSRSNRKGDGKPFNYGSAYYGGATRDVRNTKRDISQTNRARHEFSEIVIESKSEAQDVRTHLLDLILDYGAATVADFYDLVGVSGNFTDRSYGWTDLRGLEIVRTRGGGYIVDLPRPILLD